MTSKQKNKFLAGKRCVVCGTEENLTVDHVVPISWLNGFGFADLYRCKENLQAMCKTCNSLKGSRLDHRHPNTLKFMIKVIERWKDFNGIEKPRRKYVFRTLDVKSDYQTTYFEPVRCE